MRKIFTVSIEDSDDSGNENYLNICFKIKTMHIIPVAESESKVKDADNEENPVERSLDGTWYKSLEEDERCSRVPA